MRGTWLLACTLTLLACTQDPPDNRLPTAQLVEDMRIAALPDSAGDPIDVEVGLGGTMFVLMPGLQQIRVFDPSGQLVNVIRGLPQPFVRPIQLGNLAGYLSVYDSATRVLHLIQANGQPFSALRFQSRSAEERAGSTRVFQQMLRDSSVLIREYDGPARGGRLLRASTRGDVDTVTSLTPTTVVLFSANDGMLVTANDLPAAGDSVGFVLTKMNLVGDTVFTIGRRNRGRAEQRGFSLAVMAPNGNIIVRHGESDRKTVRWTVFTMLGQPLESYEGPAGVDFIAATPNQAYGVRTRDGVRELVRYNVVRGG